MAAMNETSDPRDPGTPADAGAQHDSTQHAAQRGSAGPGPAAESTRPPASPPPFAASGEHPPPYPPPYAGQQSPSPADSFFDAVRRTGLVRSDQRWIGGVAGGVALRLGIDPLIVRGLLGVSILLGGLGLILYGLAWLLLPERRDGRIHLQQLFRGDFDAAVLGGFAVFVTGLSFPDHWTPGIWWGGDSGLWNGLLWISAVILIVVLIISSSSGRPQTWTPSPPPAPGQPPTAPGAPTPPPPGTTYPTYPAATPRRQPEGPTTTMYPTPAPGPHERPATPPAPTTAQYATQSSPGPQAGYQQSQYGQSQYGQAPYPQAQYPAGAWKPAPVGPATVLPRPATRGPGAGAAGIVVAVTLLTFAGLLYAQRVGSFDGPVALTTGAVTVTLLGIGVIIAGLRGRTGGGMGVLAVVLAVALVPIAAFDGHDWEGTWEGSWGGESIAVGDIERTPTTVTEATDGYRIGAGDIDIDLTQVPLGEETVTVPITLGAGDLVIVLPAGVGYDAAVDVRAGEVNFLGSDGRTDSGQVIDRTYESPALEAGEPLQLHLDISVGAGTVTIEEAGR